MSWLHRSTNSEESERVAVKPSLMTDDECCEALEPGSRRLV
jgi:hypothetical protein